MRKEVLFTMIFLNSIYILMVVIFILDVFSYVEIKGENLKKIIHFGVIFALIILVSINFFVFKSKKWNVLVGITSITYILLMSSILYNYDLLQYLFSQTEQYSLYFQLGNPNNLKHLKELLYYQKL